VVGVLSFLNTFLALRYQRTMVVCAEETPGCTETGAESAEMPQTRFNLIQIMLA